MYLSEEGSETFLCVNLEILPAVWHQQQYRAYAIYAKFSSFTFFYVECHWFLV